MLRARERRDGRRLLHQRLREPGERAAHARDPRGGAARASTSRPRARCCRRSSSTSASRPPSPTPCCSPLVGGYVQRLGERLRGRRLRRRPAAAALRRRRDDAEALVAAVRRAPRRLGHRRRRDRLPPPRARCAASRTRSASTWAAPAPTSRSSTAARCARPTSGRSSTATRSASRASRSSRSAPAAARWPGSTQAGSLRNGPQSAGADPGPACYGRGGDAADQHRREPRARPARHRAGRRRDDARPRPAERADHATASPSRSASTLLDAASAVIQVANANMADAVRLISIRRGYDPRDFALVAFGGAGAAARRRAGARAVDPDRARPAQPGHHLGARLPARRHPPRPGRRCTCAAPDAADPAEIEAEFEKLEDEARERLRDEGVPDEHVSLQRTIAMRYLGQWRSLAVPVDAAVAVARRGGRALPRRARARVHLPPRRRAGRDLPARPAGDRRDAEAGVRAPRADRRATTPPSRHRARRCSSTSRRVRRRRRSTTATTSPPATVIAGPGDRSSSWTRRSSCRPDVTAEVDEWLNHPHAHRGGCSHEHRASAPTRSTRSPSRC